MVLHKNNDILSSESKEIKGGIFATGLNLEKYYE